MDAKLLTESGWKAIAAESDVKDNGLQKALAAYEKAGDQHHDERLKALALVEHLAATLKKVKQVAETDAAKYLASMVTAAEAAKNEIEKAKAAAAKAAIEAKKKAEAEAKTKGPSEADQEEEEEGDYAAKLLAAWQKLKSAKELAYQFIICDAKPHLGLMVAKRITPKHKEEMTKLTGGKRFLPIGTCHVANGKFVFTVEKPVPGLARKLQDSIKNFTGKKLPITVGTESAEADDEPGPHPSGPAAPAPVTEPPGLAQAPEHWHKTLQTVEASINQLKAAARKEFAKEGPDILAEVEQTIARFDGVLASIDRSLADSLAKAHAAKDAAARNAELKKARDILGNFITHVTSDQLIAHIDDNPWGIKTNLRLTLSESLKHLGQTLRGVGATG
jgi:hypothetical protein